VPSFLFGIKLGQCANVVERWRNQRDDLINKTVFNAATFGLAIDMIAMPSSRVMAKAAAKAKTLKGSAVIEEQVGKPSLALAPPPTTLMRRYVLAVIASASRSPMQR